jgi:hypothetical protein
VGSRFICLSTGKGINGLVFKFIPEAQWKEFGISFGGLIILREHIMKQVGVEKVLNIRAGVEKVLVNSEYTSESP